MKRRYLRILAGLATAVLGTVLANSCSIGNSPDNPDCLFFCDRSTEKAQTPLLTDTPIALSQTVSGKPA